MLKFLLGRLASGLILIIGVMVAVFLLVKLAPGDPVNALIGTYPAPPEYRASIAERYGLNDPLFVQLLDYLANLATFNLGYSFVASADVIDLIMSRLPATLLLVIPGVTLGAFFGILVGSTTGGSPRRGLDFAGNFGSMLAMAIPSFWLGQILIIVFALQLGWFPAFGMASISAPNAVLPAALDIAWHLVLPLTALTVFEFASVARIARGSTIDTLSQDYIVTAEMKRLPQKVILRRHVLRNSSLPVVTVIGNRFGRVLAGAILIESVFGWPGMGLLLKTSVERRDNLTVLGIVLLIAIMVVLANIIQDVLYRMLDPRIRMA
jgi:peptide/nickel transport system permease protein